MLLRWQCFAGRLDPNHRGASWTPAQHLVGLAQAFAWIVAGVLIAFAPRIARRLRRDPRWQRAARSALAWQALPVAGLLVADLNAPTTATVQVVALTLVLVPLGAGWTHRSWRVLGTAAVLPMLVLGVDVFYGGLLRSALALSGG